MAIDKKKVKTLIGIGGVALGAAFIGMEALAKKKKRNSVYDNEPEQKNPLEGKKVVFVEDENDPENADGARGHLEAVGDSDYKPGFYDKYGKRAMDIVLSFGGLVLLSPIYAGIALAIKIDDPGPVLFTQKRMGQNKQYFKLHKFRSMKMSTPHDVPTHMLDNPDQYITKVGKFLRAHSLDELPQIWDIFIGNMSVIGPRPGLWNQDILTAERDKYGANDVMIIYSLPLMPSSLAWWVMNASDKYMLIAFIGIQANGLYAVAHKLPTLINLCNSLFFQAWQLSAVEESDSNSKQTFYTNVFNTLAMVLLIVCSVLLLIMKPLMHVLVSSDYGEAWKLTPFLVISMVFSAFSSFIGTNYTVTKKTGGALKTTIIGALVNVVLNYFLIKAWGINGAAFATMVSFFVMWIVRAIDTREFIKIKYQYTKMVISLVAIFVQAFVIAVGSTYVFMVGLICLVIVIISYNKDVMTIINEIIKVLRRRLR